MFLVLSEGHSSPALSCCQKLALSDSCQIKRCERMDRREERVELRDILLTPARLFYHVSNPQCLVQADKATSLFQLMSNCEAM